MNQKLTAALERNRDVQTPFLELKLPIASLLNKSYCKVLSDDLRGEIGRGWEVRKAVQSLRNTLPQQTGLYMFMWRPHFTFSLAEPEGTDTELIFPLYVGRAGGRRSDHTLRSRFSTGYARFLGADNDPTELWSGRAPTSRDERLARFLMLEPIEYWYLVMEDPDALESIESRLIRLLEPPINILGKSTVLTRKKVWTNG